MVDPMLAGAAIFAVGVLIGRFLPARRRGRKAPEPICGCGHHRSYHDPKTGECHRRVSLGYYQGQENYAPCGCKQYSGPVPLDEIYAGEITDA